MIEVHAYIEVTDAEAGIAFYCGGLGLTVKRQFTRHWIELAGAKTPIFLLAEMPAEADLGSRKVPRDFGRHWTPVHIDFIVDDLDGTVARLVAAGAKVEKPTAEKAYGRICWLSDPFGNGFDLIQFNDQAYAAVSRGGDAD
jgi:predicted enzyme related to lactoylglutathione lyase